MRAGGFSSDFLIKTLLAGLVGTATVVVFATAMTIAPRESAATPLFHRMTGRACSYCHIRAQEPKLNPRGREFKRCIDDGGAIKDCAQ